MPATRETKRRSAPAPQKRSPVMPIAIGVIVLLGLVAIVASRGGSGGDGAGSGDATAGVEQTRPVEVTGAALPDYGGGDDTAIGTPAPVVEGETFDGDPITIGGDGEPQVVFFLAHWCPHCQREVPVITKWLDEEGAPEGVTLKAVSTGVNDDAPNYPPSEWLDREGWDIETLADDEDSSVGSAFGLTGYPFFVAIDGDGDVVARASGELEVDQIEALVDAARG